MTVEYYTRKNIFSNCKEAMVTTMKEKRELERKHESGEVQNFSKYVDLASDFLALSEQFKKNVPSEYSHYPRLAVDMAIEVLKLNLSELNDYTRNDYIRSVVENFDINDVLHC